MPLSANERLNSRYEISEIIAEGGMAFVYLAYDHKYQRNVAVKVLKEELQNDEKSAAAFKREAEIMKKLMHRNIVETYETNTHNGMMYIAMQYVPGVSLEEHIDYNRADRDFIGSYAAVKSETEIFQKLLDALKYCHDRDILHKDVKPGNILMDDHDRPFLSDFGIAGAKVKEGGDIMGSLCYLAPELAANGTANEATDVYAAAVVLYEMLCLKLPYEAETLDELIEIQKKSPVLPSELNPGVSKALDEVLMKALQNAPEKRYQNVAQFRHDVNLALHHPEGGFIKKQKKEQHRSSVIWAVLVLIAAAAIVLIAAGYSVFARQNSRIRLPSFINTDSEDAIARIEELGLEYTIETVESEMVAGTIVEQYPDYESLMYPGETVILTISEGIHSATVPEVLGKTYKEAELLFEAACLDLQEPVLVLSRDVEVGRVVWQDPEAGTKLDPFDAVTIGISGESTRMPDIVGMSYDDAVSAILSAGLDAGNVIQEESSEPAGTVLSQSIEAEEEVLWGTVVDFTISQSRSVSFTQKLLMPIVIKADNTTVTAFLYADEADEEGTQVYNAVHNAGETVELSLTSPDTGDKTLKVFADETLLYETVVTFTE